MKKKSRRALNKKQSGRSLRNRSRPTAGIHTREEIFSQPATWAETARELERSGGLSKVAQNFSPREPWLFVACGSSYYLSRVIAAQWSKLLRIRCSAVPASELLIAPNETLERAAAKQVVLISRSGKTTEVLRAAELLKSKTEMRTLGVTCNEESAFDKLCSFTLQLPWADEKSMVMTRSFTSILLLFARLGAQFAGDANLRAAVQRAPEQATAWIAANADKIRALARKRRFVDFVFLGQGAHFWLAQEAALKMTEMSSSYAQVYHTLEFRHGPKSIASRETLISFFLSDAAGEDEISLVGEVKRLGAATMVVANRASNFLRHESDLLIELGLDAPEFARMAVAAIPAQLLGLAAGLRKGLNPDEPKNLTRAVVLGSQNAPTAQRSRA